MSARLHEGYEETDLIKSDSITVMGITAKLLYKRQLKAAEALLSEQTEDKGGSTMARESAARSSMRDAARRRAEEQTHGGGGFSVNLPEGVKFFQNDGKTIEFDFVPFRISDADNPDVKAGRLAVGDLVDARFYWMHQNIGPEEKPYVCLKTFGQRCPICEAQVQMAKNPKADPDAAKALKAKERVLYNVINVDDKDGKIMVWDVSYHLFTRQLEKEQREREEYYDYADPDNGFSVRIRFAEKSFNRNQFYEADRIDFEKRKPLSDADLKAAVDLDACLQRLSYEKLEAIFLGTADDEKVGNRDDKPADRKDDRRSADAPTRGSRADTPPPTRSSRGEADEKTHRRDPDAPGERERHADEAERGTAGRHPVDPDQDCPGGGKFGAEGSVDHCTKCPDDKWKSCRDETDRLAREKKAAAKPADDAGRGGRGGRSR